MIYNERLAFYFFSVLINEEKNNTNTNSIELSAAQKIFYAPKKNEKMRVGRRRHRRLGTAHALIANSFELNF